MRKLLQVGFCFLGTFESKLMCNYWSEQYSIPHYYIMFNNRWIVFIKRLTKLADLSDIIIIISCLLMVHMHLLCHISTQKFGMIKSSKNLAILTTTKVVAEITLVLWYFDSEPFNENRWLLHSTMGCYSKRDVLKS